MKKKILRRYTEELYKKDLHDPDNHSGVITHLEQDIPKKGSAKECSNYVTIAHISHSSKVMLKIL